MSSQAFERAVEAAISADGGRRHPTTAKAIVRAVLEAIREPDEGMLSDLGGACLKWAPSAWITIIDYLLAEG